MDTSQPKQPESKAYRRQIVVVGDAIGFEHVFNTPLSELVEIVVLEARLKLDLNLVGKHMDLKTLLLAQQCSLYLYETYDSYEAMVKALDETPYVFLNHLVGQSLDDSDSRLQGPYRSYCIYQAGNEFYTVKIPTHVRKIKNRFMPYNPHVTVTRDVATFRKKDFTVETLGEGNFADLNVWDLTDQRWESRVLGDTAPYITAATTEILFYPAGEMLNHTVSPEVEQMKTDPTTRFTVFTITES